MHVLIVAEHNEQDSIEQMVAVSMLFLGAKNTRKYFLDKGMELECSCERCLVEEVKKQRKYIERLIHNQKVLKRQVDLLSSVIQVSNDGTVTIGSSDNPVDNLYVDNIGSIFQPVGNLYTVDSIAENFALRGICLNDNTAALPPSFTSFPQQWLGTTSDIQSSRAYHYAANSPDRPWVKWLLGNGVHVMVGITLEQYQQELDTLSADYLLNKPLFGNVLAIAIGNEASSGQIGQMQAGIQYARNLIADGKLPATKVTTVLKDNLDWLANTYPPSSASFTSNFLQLEPSLDIICFNMYDAYFAQGVDINTRLSWTSVPSDNKFSVTLNGFGAVRFAMSKANISKSFWCTEVGWENIDNAGIPNLKTFYTNFLNFDMTNTFVPQGTNDTVAPPDRIFYFTVRDVPTMVPPETYGLYLSSNAVGGSQLVSKFTV